MAVGPGGVDPNRWDVLPRCGLALVGGESACESVGHSAAGFREADELGDPVGGPRLFEIGNGNAPFGKAGGQGAAFIA